MAVIQKTFKTKYSAIEMKNYISTKILPSPTLAAIIDKAIWKDNVLEIESKIGNGNITIRDNQIEIYIQLSLFGSIAQKTIEEALDKEFKQLTN